VPGTVIQVIAERLPDPTVGSFNLGHSAGTLSDGRFTPIPWSNRTFAAAWQR
jgi:hypothetical protein